MCELPVSMLASSAVPTHCSGKNGSRLLVGPEPTARVAVKLSPVCTLLPCTELSQVHLYFKLTLSCVLEVRAVYSLCFVDSLIGASFILSRGCTMIAVC